MDLAGAWLTSVVITSFIGDESADLNNHVSPYNWYSIETVREYVRFCDWFYCESK